MGALAMFLGIALLVGIAIYVRVGRESEQAVPLLLDLPPEECVEQAVARMIGLNYRVSRQAPNLAIFTRPKKPDMTLGIILLLLGLVPGLLYFGLFKGTHSTNLYAMNHGTGSELTISGNDPLAASSLRSWARGTTRKGFETSG